VPVKSCPPPSGDWPRAPRSSRRCRRRRHGRENELDEDIVDVLFGIGAAGAPPQEHEAICAISVLAGVPAGGAFRPGGGVPAKAVAGFA
jgi:hypothetical protein